MMQPTPESCAQLTEQYYGCLLFLGTVGTFSIPNDRRLPSSAGPTHPLLTGVSGGQPASPGPPTIRCRGVVLLREAELSGTGVLGWYN